MDYKEITGIDDFPEPKQFLFDILGKNGFSADFIQITIDQLKGYKLVPDPDITALPMGCYIRYMPIYNFDLKAGGFVINQESHVITLGGDGKKWKVNSKKSYVFIKKKTKIQKNKFRIMLERMLKERELA